MEARSLASLNYLAANPPQYPVNPTEQRQDALTLYISRVPGTRDVILSPFKPQLKNVTAEDVASSLYYVHLDTTRPEDLGVPRHVGNSSDEGSPSRNTIKRKPVGGTQRPDTPDELPPPQPPRHLEVPVGAQGGLPQLPAFGPDIDLSPPPLNIPSRPLEDSGVGLPAGETSGSPYPDLTKPPQPELTQMPARKPLGSQAQVEPIVSAKTLSPALQPEQEPFTSSERPYSQQSYYDRSDQPDYALPHHERPYSRERDEPPPMYQSRPQSMDLRPPVHQPRPRSQDFSHPLPPPPQESQQPPPQPPRPHPVDQRRSSRSLSPRKPADSFTLSLIRRDPSSGNQWNVGRISSRHFESMPPPPADDIPAPRPPIDVQLETSGYAKFRNMPARRSIDASAPQIPEDVAHEPGIFSRQVVMSYSKSWSSTLKQKLNRLDRNSFMQKGHSRVQSFASQDSAVSADGPTMSPGPNMKPRGYVFNSPWDGRCEFRTGNAGRSVRCHHILHEGPTVNFNPLVAEQQATGTTPPSSSAMVVSELRFNLPSSEVLGNDDQGAHQRLGNLRKFWKRDDDFDEEDDEVSPFDVNLGREKAGGGNRGKRAKLGKLIIYPDGLKMLDLLVAANVGVWWGAWERSF